MALIRPISTPQSASAYKYCYCLQNYPTWRASITNLETGDYERQAYSGQGGSLTFEGITITISSGMDPTFSSPIDGIVPYDATTITNQTRVSSQPTTILFNLH